MVVKSRLEDLEGRLRLKRMWKLRPSVYPQVGKKKRKRKEEQMGRRELMMDYVRPAETWVTARKEQMVQEQKGGRRRQRETTDLFAMGK